MTDKKIRETIFGKKSKYEIIEKSETLLESTKFYIYKDGKLFQGPYSRLDYAVEAAKKEG